MLAWEIRVRWQLVISYFVSSVLQQRFGQLSKGCLGIVHEKVDNLGEGTMFHFLGSCHFQIITSTNTLSTNKNDPSQSPLGQI